MKTGAIAPHPMKDVYLGIQPSLEEIVELNVSICDWGCASWHDKHMSEDITPDLLRSPECLIEAPWDSKTDIWTLGTLLIDLLTGHNAFSAKDVHGQYDRTQHLYEVTSNFGPFPVSLLRFGNRKITIPNFDFEGEVPFPPNPCCSPPLIQSFEDLDFEDEQGKEDCLKLLWKMMQVDPRKRSSVEDLLQEAWLQDNKNNALVNILPPDEESLEQTGHVRVPSAKSFTPIQSGPPSSPVDSPVQTDTTSGLGYTTAPSGSSGWNIAISTVASDATPPPSPNSQQIERKQAHLLQVNELNQQRHEEELRSLAQEHETVLEELVKAKQKIGQLQVQNRRIFEEKSKACIAILVETEEKSTKFEPAVKAPDLEIMERDMVESAPTPSKIEIDLPSAGVMNASIEKTRAGAEEITLNPGLVLLGTALLLSCPMECFIVAGIGAAADSFFQILRAI
ncbi:putative serine/threonine-protein kinase [Venturia nashicola]|uniref:Putative serine/threonine-protein kinase n=1 Tax=Venturia nashicola TaxID=86259 RepID=A0A4Z1P8L3_9PEZI|nr:putative serine/threonine-protein kinase [Venturia nashicola]